MALGIGPDSVFDDESNRREVASRTVSLLITSSITRFPCASVVTWTAFVSPKRLCKSPRTSSIHADQDGAHVIRRPSVEGD